MKSALLAVGLCLAAGLCAAPWPASHAADGPYDVTYTARKNAPLHAAMSESSTVKATVPKGTKGIVLRWCRPEISFRSWAFGGANARRALLDKRWCEVDVGGRIGFMHGSNLKPGRR